MLRQAPKDPRATVPLMRKATLMREAPSPARPS
ncbi:hypothetical protein J2S47_000298 [Streptomyces griseoviridis]|uniref:Uncharacterized protein n=1 Tax=Streptomyces griseoviridis TaxID=45398 RepID=A0ABT9L7W3_STRGD|nr:hypothetical protein [Streptomyces griseoviridis]